MARPSLPTIIIVTATAAAVSTPTAAGSTPRAAPFPIVSQVSRATPTTLLLTLLLLALLLKFVATIRFDPSAPVWEDRRVTYLQLQRRAVYSDLLYLARGQRRLMAIRTGLVSEIVVLTSYSASKKGCAHRFLGFMTMFLTVLVAPRFRTSPRIRSIAVGLRWRWIICTIAMMGVMLVVPTIIVITAIRSYLIMIGRAVALVARRLICVVALYNRSEKVHSSMSTAVPAAQAGSWCSSCKDCMSHSDVQHTAAADSLGWVRTGWRCWAGVSTGRDNCHPCRD